MQEWWLSHQTEAWARLSKQLLHISFQLFTLNSRIMIIDHVQDGKEWDDDDDVQNRKELDDDDVQDGKEQDDDDVQDGKEWDDDDDVQDGK